MATYQTDPYGNVTACIGTTVTVPGSNLCSGTITVSSPFVFQGQYRDDETPHPRCPTRHPGLPDGG